MSDFDIDRASGFVEESILEELTTSDVIGGTTPVISAISTTVIASTAVTALTLEGGACPSSACTRSC